MAFTYATSPITITIFVLVLFRQFIVGRGGAGDGCPAGHYHYARDSADGYYIENSDGDDCYFFDAEDRDTCIIAARENGKSWEGNDNSNGFPKGCYWGANGYYWNTASSDNEDCGMSYWLHTIDCVCLNCQQCSPGKYSSGNGNSDCNTCPSGKYANGNGNTACNHCPADKPCIGDTCTLTGATSSSYCKAGPTCDAGKGVEPSYFSKSSGKCDSYKYILTKEECTSIAKSGLNKDSVTTENTNSYPRGCYQYDGNSVYFNEATSSTISCSDGNKCICRSKSCESCDSGYYSSGGENAECKKCDAGRYASSSQTSSCTQCPANKPCTGPACTLTGATSISECKTGPYCDPGKGVEGNPKICTICEKGYYSAGGENVYCTECAVGKYSDATQASECIKCPDDKPCTGIGDTCELTGATSSSYCLAGPTCDPGMGFIGNSEVCTTCDKGYYSPGGPNIHCTQCPANKACTGPTCTQTGSISIGECKTGPTCDPGKGVEGNPKVCTICDKGYYSAGGENINCTKCPANKIFTGIDGKLTGSTSIDLCNDTVICNAGDGINTHVTITTGTCENQIMSEGECMAAQLFNQLDDSNLGWGESVDSEDYPQGCSIYNNKYYFNSNTASTFACDSTKRCVCFAKHCAACSTGYNSVGGKNALCSWTVSEWDCASSTNSRGYVLSNDCTIQGNNHVVVYFKLEITGNNNANVNNLVTITAATNNRHFYLNGQNEKLTLRYLKLVGGNVINGNGKGGSIFIEDRGKLNLYSSIIDNNNANYGGGIASYGLYTIFEIFNSSIVNNKATSGGGGIITENSGQEATFEIYHSTIAHNDGDIYGGGMSFSSGNVVLYNTTIKNNTAKVYGGGLRIKRDINHKPTKIKITRCKIKWNKVITTESSGKKGGGGLHVGSNTIAFIRESSIISNLALNNRGHEIYIENNNTIAVINTDIGNRFHQTNESIFEVNEGTVKWKTCTSSNTLCANEPFTGTCTATDPTNAKYGILCNYNPDLCVQDGKVLPSMSLQRLIASEMSTIPPCTFPPKINHFYPNETSTLGNVVTSFHGEGFLYDDFSQIPVITFGTEKQWKDVTRYNSTYMTAVALPGTGSNINITVAVDGIDSVGNHVTFSYMAPNITALKSPPFAGGWIQIYGTNFGSDVNKLSIIIDEGECGQESCANIEFTEGGNLKCLYNYQGLPSDERGVVVTVGCSLADCSARSSARAVYRYDINKGQISGVNPDLQDVIEGNNHTYKIGLTVVPETMVNISLKAISSDPKYNCTAIPSYAIFYMESTVATTVPIIIKTQGNQIDEGDGKVAYTCEIEHRTRSVGLQFDEGLVQSVNINVINDDEADLKLWTFNSETNNYDYDVKFIGPLSTFEGGKLEYGVGLDTQPRFPVTIKPIITMPNVDTILAPPIFEVHPDKLIFSQTNWNIRQKLTLFSKQDNVDNDEVGFFSILRNINTNCML